jgi:hypothetical protein
MMEDERISNLPRGRGYPHAYLDMVWTGSTYGLAWVWEYSAEFWWSEVTFTLVDGDGVPSGVEVTGSTGISPVIAWTGSEFAIASMGPMLGPAMDLSLLRVNAEGDTIVDETAPVAGLFPQIAWSGSELGLTRSLAGTTGEVVFIRLDPGGSVVGTDLTLAPTEPMLPAVAGLAWTGSEYGVVWTGLEFARVSADGSSRSDPVALAESGNPLRVGLVWTGSGYGAAWITGGHEVAFTTFGPEGLDASEVAVLGEGYSGPDIAWTGSRFGILWAHGDEVVLRMVDPRGEADGESIAIADGAMTEVVPAIAWTGSELGVAWYDTRYLETEGNWIFVNRIGFCE